MSTMRHPTEADRGPRHVGDVLSDLARVGELPPAGALTLPSTPRSSPQPPRSTAPMCRCGGCGLLHESIERATAEQLVVIDTYAVASTPPRTLALVPCVCAAGAARVERWRNLPAEAAGVQLRGGRVKAVADQAEALAKVKAFIKQPRGWLTLAGDYGVGKTTLLYAALNHLADRGVYGRYVMMSDLLDGLRTALRNDDDTYASRLRQVASAPVLAIDELDKMRESPFVDEVLEAIFLPRYQDRHRLGTLIGYNVDRAEKLPRWLRSRIGDARFHLVEMRGADLRPIADELDPWDRGVGE